MHKKELIKRYIVLISGLFFTALGVAFSKKAELGVSTISSVPNVVSLAFTSVSMGTWSMLWNFVLIAGQAIILRREFKAIQLLQILISVLFGYFIDFCIWCLSPITVNAYLMRISFSLLGILILAFGVAISVIANVIMNPGEAFVNVVAGKLNKNFGNVKTVFDFCCVSLAVILSLIFFNFRIEGVREGTVLAVILTGTTVKLISKYVRKPLESFFAGNKRP